MSPAQAIVVALTMIVVERLLPDMRPPATLRLIVAWRELSATRIRRWRR